MSAWTVVGIACSGLLLALVLGIWHVLRIEQDAAVEGQERAGP
jgi:hypothetical protein